MMLAPASRKCVAKMRRAGTPTRSIASSALKKPRSCSGISSNTATPTSINVLAASTPQRIVPVMRLGWRAP